jgi:hypothetical protein
MKSQDEHAPLAAAHEMLTSAALAVATLARFSLSAARATAAAAAAEAAAERAPAAPGPGDVRCCTRLVILPLEEGELDEGVWPLLSVVELNSSDLGGAAGCGAGASVHGAGEGLAAGSDVGDGHASFADGA